MRIDGGAPGGAPLGESPVRTARGESIVVAENRYAPLWNAIGRDARGHVVRTADRRRGRDVRGVYQAYQAYRRRTRERKKGSDAKTNGADVRRVDVLLRIALAGARGLWRPSAVSTLSRRGGASVWVHRPARTLAHFPKGNECLRRSVGR